VTIASLSWTSSEYGLNLRSAAELRRARSRAFLSSSCPGGSSDGRKPDRRAPKSRLARLLTVSEPLQELLGGLLVASGLRRTQRPPSTYVPAPARSHSVGFQWPPGSEEPSDRWWPTSQLLSEPLAEALRHRRTPKSSLATRRSGSGRRLKRVTRTSAPPPNSEELVGDTSARAQRLWKHVVEPRFRLQIPKDPSTKRRSSSELP